MVITIEGRVFIIITLSPPTVHSSVELYRYDPWTEVQTIHKARFRPTRRVIVDKSRLEGIRNEV